MHLATRRLLLREYVEDDWRVVLVYQSDPRYLRYYPWTERTETDVKAFVHRFVEQQAQLPRTRWQLALTLPAETGRLIGSCGIRLDADERTSANIGYELDPQYWGRGLATEAASEILRFGFENLGLHRTWAQCVAQNAASAHVLEKLGMRLEGHERESGWFKGRWWDRLTYAILEQER